VAFSCTAALVGALLLFRAIGLAVGALEFDSGMARSPNEDPGMLKVKEDGAAAARKFPTERGGSLDDSSPKRWRIDEGSRAGPGGRIVFC
jgi:hypothetical protein